MRFLIYGAGVIGSIFAGRLAAAGHDVTVLARGGRLEEIEQRGIVLKSVYGGPEERIPVKIISALEPDDIYDYILVPVQRQQVDAVLPALEENRSPAVLFMVNTASAYPEWARKGGEERMMGGFPGASGSRETVPGVSEPEGTGGTAVEYFIARGPARLFQTTTFGEYRGTVTPRLRRLIRAVRRAGIPAVVSKDMEAWQRTHVVVVLAFACALYAVDCDARRLSESQEYVRLLIRAIQEGFAVLETLGTPVTPGKLRFVKIPVPLLVPVFRALLKTRLAEAAMASHVSAAREEMACLSRELDELVLLSAVETPAWDRLKRLRSL